MTHIVENVETEMSNPINSAEYNTIIISIIIIIIIANQNIGKLYTEFVTYNYALFITIIT